MTARGLTGQQRRRGAARPSPSSVGTMYRREPQRQQQRSPLLLNRNIRAPRRGDTLHLAARRGKQYRVVACLAKGQDPNSMDSKGYTPLYIACALGHLEVAKLLLRAGAEVNIRTLDGASPVDAAIGGDCAGLLLELIYAGADLSTVDSKGYPVMLRAAGDGRTAAILEFLSAGVEFVGASAEKTGKTALILAARGGHLEVVQSLLGAGADVMRGDRMGWTSLHFAAWKGHLEVVWELLGACANSAAAAKKGWTPLMAAALAGHSEVVQQLVGAGAPLPACTNKGWNALHMAAQSGHRDIVRYLLAAGAPANDVAEKGWTALMTAAAEGHPEVVQDLLAYGACIDTRNRNGCTSLIMAASKGRTDVVRELVQAGADLAPAPVIGWPALVVACDGGHVDAVRHLLEGGADPLPQDIYGVTPLHDACEDGRIEVAVELLKAGANPNPMTAAGETPLTMARRSGRLDIITILLEAGAAAITSSAGARSTTDNRNNQNNNNNGDDVGVTTSSSNATYRSAGTVGSSSHYTGTSNLSVSTEILSLTSPRDVNVFASARTLTPASGIRPSCSAALSTRGTLKAENSFNILLKSAGGPPPLFEGGGLSRMNSAPADILRGSGRRTNVQFRTPRPMSTTTRASLVHFG